MIKTKKGDQQIFISVLLVSGGSGCLNPGRDIEDLKLVLTSSKNPISVNSRSQLIENSTSITFLP